MAPRSNPRRNPRRKQTPTFIDRRSRDGELPRVYADITCDAHEVFLSNLEADRLKLFNDHQTMRIKELENDLENARDIAQIQQATIISLERTVKSCMRTCNVQAHRMQKMIAKETRLIQYMNRVLQILARTSGVAMHPVNTFLQRVSRARKMDVLEETRSPEAVESPVESDEENVVTSV